MIHRHSGDVEASQRDHGKVDGVERELLRKLSVMMGRCREGAAQGIVECVNFWKNEQTALACYEHVCLV